MSMRGNIGRIAGPVLPCPVRSRLLRRLPCRLALAARPHNTGTIAQLRRVPSLLPCRPGMRDRKRALALHGELLRKARVVLDRLLIGTGLVLGVAHLEHRRHCGLDIAAMLGEDVCQDILVRIGKHAL